VNKPGGSTVRIRLFDQLRPPANIVAELSRLLVSSTELLLRNDRNCSILAFWEKIFRMSDERGAGKHIRVEPHLYGAINKENKEWKT
jgi:hypothetical protein